MPAQLTYSQNMVYGLPGQVAHDFGQGDIVSRLAEGAISPGVIVSRGTDKDNQVTAGGDATAWGLSIRDVAREVDSGGDPTFTDKSVLPVMREGYAWVTVADAGDPGDVLNYVDASGAIGVGAPEAGETALPEVTLETTVTAGGIAIVRVNF
jgi:hypothetical protein